MENDAPYSDEKTRIVDEIYDSKIEDPEYQSLMRSVIRAWIFNGIAEGVRIGKEELALELDIVIQKARNPNVKTIAIERLTSY